ncbi:hypothetical protein J3R30DRAFT_3694676 [Lentinula aciculospora]|uniref:Uncharacterized protein n=1 Tax=Lentinula aciculospora TaxID=153920 RepID=A0A9W9AUR1_9AGAR|nr:hypothetical protein J3R30DRAFT_3694676 [Lentinula aciculospora]
MPLKLSSCIKLVLAYAVIVSTISTTRPGGLVPVGASPVTLRLFGDTTQNLRNDDNINVSSGAVHKLAERSTRLILLGYTYLPRDVGYVNNGVLTSGAVSNGPLGNVVYLSPQLCKFVRPPPQNYQECTVAGDVDLLHKKSNPILYVDDRVLNDRTALQGYIYTAPLPKKSKKTSATTILVAKEGEDNFMMGIPQAKFNQIGMRVWCAPQGCTKNNVTARWNKDLQIIDWPQDLRMPFVKPSENSGTNTPSSSASEGEEGSSMAKENEKQSICDRLPDWVKELFTLLPLM